MKKKIKAKVKLDELITVDFSDLMKTLEELGMLKKEFCIKEKGRNDEKSSCCWGRKFRNRRGRNGIVGKTKGK